jgi:serine/threonine protein kinase
VKELKLQNCRLDGRYDIFECLGRGSYSEIYCARAINPPTPGDREVVIKALNVFLQGSPEADLERTLIENFQNEALALDRVRHPHIIRRLGHGTAIDMAGQPFHYLVLEYMSGGDLHTICRAKPFRLENALYYLEQVCQGLAHAHSCGVIHRDIKPQNLLLTLDRRTVKIADFGVAKLNPTDEQITRVGTNVYAPPEHSPSAHAGADENAPRQRLTPSADIYSLAKTLYTLIVGESPRDFIHKPITALPYMVSQQPWAAGLLRVLEKATQTNPAERYQRVEAFWEDITAAAIKSAAAQETGVTAPRISRELPAAAPALTAAPPRPSFEAATAIKNQDLPYYRDTPEPRAKLVVPVSEPPLPPATKTTFPDDIISNLPAAPPISSRRSARLALALALIIMFVGMLLATNYYVKNRNRQANANRADNRGTTTPPANPPATTGVNPGDEGFALTTDINLRSSPNANSKSNIRGTIGKGSRVRVLQTRGDWAEVQVLDYVAPSISKPRADRGWLNARYIKFN